MSKAMLASAKSPRHSIRHVDEGMKRRRQRHLREKLAAAASPLLLEIASMLSSEYHLTSGHFACRASGQYTDYVMPNNENIFSCAASGECAMTHRCGIRRRDNLRPLCSARYLFAPSHAKKSMSPKALSRAMILKPIYFILRIRSKGILCNSLASPSRISCSSAVIGIECA